MHNKILMRFGDLKIGQQFFEQPDEFGGAFIFPLTKTADFDIGDGEGGVITTNAQCGAVRIRFEENEIVKVII